MKRSIISLLGSLAIVGLSCVAASAESPNLTGNWTVEQTGLNGSNTNAVVLKQSGMGVVGTSANGNGFTGTFVSDAQINGTWHGPGGAGWLTVYVTPNGHSFNGTWGYNGRKSNGTFVANKVLPPSPITAAGKWNVNVAGTPSGGISGPMSCTESGPSVLCKAGAVTINGKFRTKDKVRATWTNGSRNGWFSFFWFNGDNNSFNGTWGYGKDSSPPTGRVVGQRSLS